MICNSSWGMGKGEWEIQVSSYRMSKSWGWKLQCREYSQRCCDRTLWWQMVATPVSLAWSISDQGKSLHCTLEINTVFQLYPNEKKNLICNLCLFAIMREGLLPPFYKENWGLQRSSDFARATQSWTVELRVEHSLAAKPLLLEYTSSGAENSFFHWTLCAHLNLWPSC